MVVSGDSQEHLGLAMVPGDDGVLRKPFDNDELLATARELLEMTKPSGRATRARSGSGYDSLRVDKTNRRQAAAG